MADRGAGRRRPQLDDVLVAVGDAARRLGIDTYLVGGFVRDRLMGTIGKDIDLLTVGAAGIPVLDQVARRFGWSRPQVFERFGTGQIRGDGWILEVVQARAERYDPESRKPSVAPGTLDEDIWRRDFTVNALCQTVDGDVIDRTGRGLDDLRAGVLRTPLDPADTFSEDPLRMFRGARFVAQLGFALAPGTLAAMRDVAPRSAILSVERITEEFRRLLCSAHPRAGLEVMRDGGLLKVVIPEALEGVGMEQGGYHIYDVFDHSAQAVADTPPDPLTRLAAFFHDIGKPRTHVVTPEGKHTFYNHPEVGAVMAEAIMGRLRFSNEEIRDVTSLVRLHLRPIQYQPSTHGDSAVRRLIRDAGPLRRPLLDLARGDTRASSYPDTDTIDALEARMEALDQDGTVSAPVCPLDGNALMALTGRGPGRWIGTVKRALEEAMLDGEISPGDSGAARTWLAHHPELLTE